MTMQLSLNFTKTAPFLLQKEGAVDLWQTTVTQTQSHTQTLIDHFNR